MTEQIVAIISPDIAETMNNAKNSEQLAAFVKRMLTGVSPSELSELSAEILQNKLSTLQAQVQEWLASPNIDAAEVGKILNQQAGMFLTGFLEKFDQDPSGFEKFISWWGEGDNDLWVIIPFVFLFIFVYVIVANEKNKRITTVYNPDDHNGDIIDQ